MDLVVDLRQWDHVLPPARALVHCRHCRLQATALQRASVETLMPSTLSMTQFMLLKVLWKNYEKYNNVDLVKTQTRWPTFFLIHGVLLLSLCIKNRRKRMGHVAIFAAHLHVADFINSEWKFNFWRNIFVSLTLFFNTLTNYDHLHQRYLGYPDAYSLLREIFILYLTIILFTNSFIFFTRKKNSRQ